MSPMYSRPGDALLDVWAACWTYTQVEYPCTYLCADFFFLFFLFSYTSLNQHVAARSGYISYELEEQFTVLWRVHGLRCTNWEA